MPALECSSCARVSAEESHALLDELAASAPESTMTMEEALGRTRLDRFLAMKLVLDASVAVASVRPSEPAYAAARARVARVLQGLDELIEPLTFRVEVGGARDRRTTGSLQTDEWTETWSALDEILGDTVLTPLDRFRRAVLTFFRSERQETGLRIALDETGAFFRAAPEARARRWR